jgi:hypothetical protein
MPGKSAAHLQLWLAMNELSRPLSKRIPDLQLNKADASSFGDRATAQPSAMV